MKKYYSFNNITLKDIKEIVSLEILYEDEIFSEWFSFDYNFSAEDREFLENLIEKNRRKFLIYLEEELKAKFLIPIFNRIDFEKDGISDWYERSLKAKVSSTTIGGTTDFLVAKGIDEPEKPIFFIQEFKKTKTKSDPEYQLLAEMLVALNMNEENIIRGAFVIGVIWNFVILKKEGEVYKYYISDSLYSSKIEDLKKIYSNLVAVKEKYCK